MIEILMTAIIFGGSSALLFSMAPRHTGGRLVEAASWLGIITVVLVVAFFMVWIFN